METIQGVNQDRTSSAAGAQVNLSRSPENASRGYSPNPGRAETPSYSQSSDSQSGCSQPACTQEPRNQFAGGQELCGLHTLGVLNSGY